MDFSKMLHEILDIIAHKHIIFYEDYLSFALVCKSWRASALYAVTKRHNNSNGPPSRLPSLMLSEKEEDEEFRELFLLSNKSIRKIRFPKAYGKVCMSSCGWLLTLGDDHVAKLIDPLSCKIINLPNLSTLSRHPEIAVDLDWKMGIKNLVFLPQLSLVVVVSKYFSQLGFCRIGDNKWISLERGWKANIYDITYYNGRLYSFDSNYYIRVCDVLGEDPTNFINVSCIPKDLFDNWLVTACILGLDDDDGRRRLLVVIRERTIYNAKCSGCITKGFQVLEYDLENEKWSKVKDLGRKSLFVGYGSSSFWIEDTGGVIKGNCIYYTDLCYGRDVDLPYI